MRLLQFVKKGESYCLKQLQFRDCENNFVKNLFSKIERQSYEGEMKHTEWKYIFQKFKIRS